MLLSFSVFVVLLRCYSCSHNSHAVELGVYLQDTADLSNYELLSEDLRQVNFEILPLKKGNDKVPVVAGRFEDTLFNIGWGILHIESNPKFHDGVQAYFSGVLEGYMTASHISTFAVNAASTIFKDINSKLIPSRKSNGIEPMPDRVKKYLNDQEEWTINQVKMNTRDKHLHEKDYYFFFHVGLLMEQFRGLEDGYRYKFNGDAKLNDLDHSIFQMIQATGDLFDIVPALYPELQEDLNYHYFSPLMTTEEVVYHHGLRSACSAFIKILPGNEDILFGHNAWFSFSFTNRIFKHYKLHFNNYKTASHGISFSSYPGMLVSLDDFYLLSNGLAMIQTSNEVLDKTIYNLKAESLLAWQRVRVSSSLSKTGEQYFKNMKKHFSGTYANQYMVINLNKFTPGQPLKNGTLWVIEEMPNVIVGADQTELLSFGYWASYNVPFYDDIYRESGYERMTKMRKTNFFDHALTPRAELFKAYQSSVTNLDTLKQLLRRNEYKDDAYSLKNPSFALCSRYDLLSNKTLKTPYGCYDAKVTSFLNGAKDRSADIISGPTEKRSYGAPYIERFSWSAFPNNPHFGLPDAYNFKFFTTKPISLRGYFKPKLVRTVEV